MEQSRNRLVVDADKFKQQYQDPSNQALTHDQNQHVFGDYYQIGADGTPLLDPRAFEDPRCAQRYGSMLESNPMSDGSGHKPEKYGRDKRLVAAATIVGVMALSYGGSVAYEAWGMKERNPISNPSGYGWAMVDGFFHYYTNYFDMADRLQGKPTEAERLALAKKQSLQPLIAPETIPSPASTKSKPTQSATPSPSPSSSITADNKSIYPDVPVRAYERDKQGNILGFAATYKKDSKLTDEQVTQMETCGNTTNDVVLTFDDPASDKQLDAITNILEKEKVGGVFFVNILDKPKISQNKIDELREKGFWVASHGGTHADLTKLSDAEIERVIVSGGAATLYRPAYGATYTEKGSNNIYFDDRVKKIADNIGKNVCMWTLDTQDWKGVDKVSAETIVATVKKNMTDRSVILMHGRMPETVKALPEIIAVARSKKLGICTASGPTSSEFTKTPLCK